MTRGILGLLRGGGNLRRSFVDGRYQVTNSVNGEIHGVRDGACEILGYRGVVGEVTVGEVGHFVQQSQDGFLVLLVLVFGGLYTAPLVGKHLYAKPGQDQQCHGAEGVSHLRLYETFFRGPRIAVLQLQGSGKQGIGISTGAAGGSLQGQQFFGNIQQLSHVVGHRTEQHGHFA